MATKIHWTSEEWNLVVQAFIDTDWEKWKGVGGVKTITSSVEHCMKGLPKARRRPLNSHRNASIIWSTLKALVQQEMKQRADAAVVTEAAPEVIELKEEAPDLELVISPEKSLEPSAASDGFAVALQTTIEEKPREALLDVMGEFRMQNFLLREEIRHVTRITEQVLVYLGSLGNQKIVEEFRKQLQAGPVIQKTRVLIIGLRNDQQQQVKGTIGALIDPLFLSSGVQLTRSMLEARQHVDHVFVMTRFTNHVASSMSFDVFGRDRTHLVPKGPSGLIQEIARVLPQLKDYVR